MTRPFLLASLLFACADGGSGYRGGGGDGGWGDWKKKRTEPITVVETTRVARGPVSDMLVTSGVIEAERSADVNPSASGTVVSVHAEIGDTVRRGQLLAVIDNATLDAGAERAAAEVAHLESQLAEAESLLGRGAISQREVNDLVYQLANARTSLTEASRTQGETQLTAPFGGVVAARELRVGELASSAARAFQVVDLADLRVTVSLPERDVARVKTGQQATLTGSYDADAVGNAVVSRISPVIDATSGTFQVVLTLDEEQSALRPGQYVSADIEVDRHEDVIVVPREAIRYEQGRPVAWRVDPAPPKDATDKGGEWGGKKDEEASGWSSWFGGGDKDDEADEETEDTPKYEGPKLVATRVTLELGLMDERRAEVLEGLAIDDEIIVIGHSNLRDGARVRHPREEDAEGEPSADEQEGADDNAASGLDVEADE